ncbi:flavin reductase [Micromonospora sp. WMMD998]|uniref:flavin reductase n=1 Tax=Micromonospora sp. WMMD998 TaxID=3016092 RepID=UPI00249BD984|nr:flavin reductase [Micromonospora sp. WMMD998]WFE37075.1 flavin reductase [Micromonospora sp. WMMD998]
MSRPHVAGRPTWRCDACDRPWPCEAARRALLVEYCDDRAALAIYLATLLVEATGHLTDAARWDRFLGWIRPGRVARPGTRLGP